MKPKNWNSILLPLAALLLGACAGVYCYDMYLRARIRNYRFQGEDLPRHIAERMADSLGLDDAQREAVYGVCKEFDLRFAEQRETNRAAVDAIRGDFAGELEKLLTPEQTEKHRRKMEEIREQGRQRRDLRRAMGEPPPPPPPR